MTQVITDTARTEPEATADYQITIKNCNSIGEAAISLRPGSLNIKYGPNGLGKSTIARALTLRTEGEGSLEELTPFKHRADDDGPRPEVTGAESISTVLTFNETYVSQFVFQRDEVLKNSFEIFINTDEYQQGLKDIASMFEALKETFTEETEFDEALTSFKELHGTFNLTKAGALAKTSKGYKALGMGGKLNNIPKPLLGYKGFIESEDPANWILWQSKGKAFLELSDNCPFCSIESVNKATATQVSVEYESAAVKNMGVLRSVIEKLGRYFEPTYLAQLEEITTSIKELTPEQSTFLVILRTQIETLLRKLSAVRALSFHALQAEDNVAEVLEELKIDLKLLHALNSEATVSVVALINGKLDEVGGQISDVKRRIGVQKTRVAKLIRDNQKAINDFLDSAGYRYSVRIEAREDSYRMLLEHQDAPGHLESAASHLSYGEKNAFALILFMHHVQRAKPDLIVLDDPISSFDKTKKFAILHQLFHGPNSLRYTTSLLLTHDIEPAIDMVRSGTSGKFKEVAPVVHFLTGRSGTVTETPIYAADIKTFSQVCESNIASANDPIIKCIYLRRLLEIHGSRGVGYQLLSNLVHLRDVPIRKSAAEDDTEMAREEVAEATKEIQKFIPDFDYAHLLSELRDTQGLQGKFHGTDVGYEKVQLFRIMSELHPAVLKGDDVFTKFVNESYHIENEYVMQLNPKDFDSVPEYVIAACTELLSKV
jgi:energy-coupling factor transporter ATP-binding protein EcfA2